MLFVEAHGGDYRACGPVDHDICQEVIQAVFPVQTALFNINYSQKYKHTPCLIYVPMIYMLKITRQTEFPFVPLQPTICQIFVLHISPGRELLQNVSCQSYWRIIYSTAYTQSLTNMQS